MQIITPEQFFLGGYLGDACFVQKTQNHNTYVVFKHAASQYEYLAWKHKVVLAYGLTDQKHVGIVKVNMRATKCFPNYQQQFRFSTISSPTLNAFKNMTDEKIIDMFGAGAFAIWVLDDGSVDRQIVKITCGSKSEKLVLALMKIMQERFGLECRYYKHPTKHSANYIAFRKKSFEKIKEIVMSYIPEDLDIVQQKFQPSAKIRIKYFDPEMEKLVKIGGCSDWIDLRAAETYYIPAGELAMIRLGVAMELPEGYEAIVAPRSSTYKKYHILQANSIGVIDHSYCGDNDEWMFPAYATEMTVVHKGDRICQFRIQKNQPEIEFEEVPALSNANRGGFGSTGV